MLQNTPERGQILILRPIRNNRCVILDSMDLEMTKLVEEMLSELDDLLEANGDRPISKNYKQTLQAFGLACVVAWENHKSTVRQALKDKADQPLQ